MDFEQLREVMVGSGVGIRSRVNLEPLGGAGDKIFPPTYGVDNQATTKYATETRRLEGQDVPCVLLDSVASQANRRELALLDAARDGEINIPVISVDFRGTDVASLDRISSLEAPHRVFDALLRDSLLDDVLFRHSNIGRAITEATHRNAAALFRWSPTTLLFGGWDSTGPKGGKGAKYERAITAEITGIHAVAGTKTSSRLDPAGIELRAGPVYQTPSGDWTTDEKEAAQDAKKQPLKVGSGSDAGRPSLVNHGNIVPSVDVRAGGVTADRIEATTVLSFPALRRLRFPLDADGKQFSDAQRPAVEQAAHTALAALGLAASVLVLDGGFDLRSRCVLAPTGPIGFELRDRSGSSQAFMLDRSEAIQLLADSVAATTELGLQWEAEEILLQPAPRLVELIRRSQEIAAVGESSEEDA